MFNHIIIISSIFLALILSGCADYVEFEDAPEALKVFNKYPETNNFTTQNICDLAPESKECLSFCENNPNDPSCIVINGKCEINPNLPECIEFCKKFPTAKECSSIGPCKLNPYSLECLAYCKANPNDPDCKTKIDCFDKPQHPSCLAFCQIYPTDPACQSIEPKKIILCYSDDSGTCETENNQIITQKTATYNTCNYTSAIKVKASGDGIDNNTNVLFSFDGLLPQEGVDTGICSRGDIFCYCPTENINKDIPILASHNNLNSNELTLHLKKREDISKNAQFTAEVIFISDYNCNANQNLQPHVNFFDFSKSEMHENDNNLDKNLSKFMPVLFSEKESRVFGKNSFQFNCEPGLFEIENRNDTGWCVAVEDWMCGSSDQDYDFVMTYETKTTIDSGTLRLSFRPISAFGADNFHIVKFYFETSVARTISYDINTYNVNAKKWTKYNSDKIEVISYTLEKDGKYSYEIMLPAGNKLFQTNPAEAWFTIE